MSNSIRTNLDSQTNLDGENREVESLVETLPRDLVEGIADLLAQALLQDIAEEK